MSRQIGIALLAVAMFAGVPNASLAVQPALLRNLAAVALKQSDEARQAFAGYHLKDVQPVSDIVPVIQFDQTVLTTHAVRPIIDARIINIYFINKARYAREPMAASTSQAIDAWTGTVIVGAPPGYGTSVDQWVAIAYYLGPR